MSEEIRNWRIEVFPLLKRDAQGSGDDAPFETVLFTGTREDAGKRGKNLCEKRKEGYRDNLRLRLYDHYDPYGERARQAPAEYPFYNSDFGYFDVGYDVFPASGE